MNWKQQLEEYENKKDWKKAVEYMTKALSEHQENPEAWVRMLYLLHNILLEQYPEKAGLDHKVLEKNLIDYFNESREKFANNPEYLFFMGVIGMIAEWYFGQKDMSLAIEMSRRAAELEPNNKLYEWEKLRNTPGKENAIKARQIAREIINSHTQEKTWLEAKGFPGRYILDVQLIGSAETSDERIDKWADKWTQS